MEKIIKSKHIYKENEIKRVSEQQIKFALNLQLLDMLQESKAIIYTQEPDLFGNIEAIATIIVNIDE